MTKSWRTTSAGILGALALIFTALSAMLDGNPETIPQWEVVIPVFITQLGLLFARDNKVTSTQAGAEPPTPTANKPANPANPTQL